MLKPLDPLLHSQLRLAIMSLLIGLDSAEFNFLLKETGASKGNLSVQLKKLEKAKYIEIKKSFRNNYPLTTVSITLVGIQAFNEYVSAIKEYLK
jgi:DNA-binding transcriptional ArsR family regulator